MIEFAWPWLAAALLLPLLVRWLPPTAHVSGSLLRLPLTIETPDHVRARKVSRLRPTALLFGLVWLALVAAAMRPQWLGEVAQPPQTGRDLLLAVDVSGSMAAEDMVIGRRRVDRLTAVKVVLGDFLSRRIGDRVGLLLFGQQAYLLTPLTFDRAHVRYQLETSVIGMAGRETAIGDAIGLAVKRLRERPESQRVLVLLTDGVNTAGTLQPLKAAELASAEGVRVYTVAIGSERGQTQMFGLQLNTAGAEIDEATLIAVAERTGGRFFRARDTGELAGIYAEVDRLEPIEYQGEPLRPRDELYVWPLALGLLFALVLVALRVREGIVWKR
ncbi:MAG: VWA domain-containing protein [Xanthomonadales bacterium]|jgi:Ca-activated chloride channel family protein|nr:VWA domain-containing protein [Xanthomonadales bacterium]